MIEGNGTNRFHPHMATDCYINMPSRSRLYNIISVTLLLMNFAKVRSLSMSAKNNLEMNAKSLTISWFRQDLRLHDNPQLNAAVQQSNRATKNDVSKGIVPLYCFDPR